MILKLPHLSIPNFRKKPWWVKIQTKTPVCTYYFGPFEAKQEAMSTQADYVDDLVREKALGITVSIEQSRPSRLTVFDDSNR